MAPCKAEKPATAPCKAPPKATNFLSGLKVSAKALASPKASFNPATLLAAAIACSDVAPNLSVIAIKSDVASFIAFLILPTEENST